jgi:hypothetical protein
MANPEHLAILQGGVEEWNAWRRRSGRRPDLHGANLTNAKLARANLSMTNLSAADLKGADLSRANLTRADLVSAWLSGADLNHAKLMHANLTDAVLTGSDLTSANFSHALLQSTRLAYADFESCRLGWTLLADVDLSKTRNLSGVRHIGPSSIDVRTVYRSEAQIPEAFLRGAGIPDQFITYAKSLVGSAIEFYSCFISYSTEDQEFADRLYADLQAEGVRCWFAPKDARRGLKLHEQIDEAIRLHEKLLLILSRHSMNSEWVKTEIAKARKREVREGIKVLFPVSLVPFDKLRDWECFDADSGKDSAREIREYMIGNFRRWKDHDAYRAEFLKLLRDLQSNKTSPWNGSVDLGGSA